MAESAPPPGPSPTPLPVITPTRIVCAILLAAPFVALLWVNSYAALTPAFIGIPFFYWYQLMWVVLSAVLTGISYLLIRREEAARKAQSAELTGDAR